jgi:pre-mRNA-splicing factor ISY1
MARNVEKAQSMLNRFLASKQGDDQKPKRRPYLATECHDLNEADKWRQDILREIGRKVMEIQNAGLGEHRIRDLNDEINKLIREKGHWERRILQLGGPDYAKTGPKVTDGEGKPVASSGGAGRGPGYKYFGAARNLPGVKDLFEKEGPRQIRRTRAQMHRSINPDYYGFRDEDDGLLVELERGAENKMREQTFKAKEAAERMVVGGGDNDEEQEEGVEDVEEEGRRWKKKKGREAVERKKEGPSFKAYVPLPDQKEIENMVLEQKKKALIAKYASDALLAEQAEAKAMLNKR